MIADNKKDGMMRITVDNGQVIISGMAQGKPFVVKHDPSEIELITHGENGCGGRSARIAYTKENGGGGSLCGVDVETIKLLEIMFGDKITNVDIE